MQENTQPSSPVEIKPTEVKTPKDRRPFLVIIAIVVILAFILYPSVKNYLLSGRIRQSLSGLLPSSPSFEKFASAEEFTNYLTSVSENTLTSGTAGVGGMVTVEDRAFTAPSAVTKEVGQGELMATDERVSETNVQVKGIDEPDIVKTDGKNLYVSQEVSYLFKSRVSTAVNVPEVGTSSVPMPDSAVSDGGTKIIAAFPPTELDKKGSIEKSGEMFYYEGTLTVFSDNKIYGYDVTNAENPQKKWQFEYESSNSIVDLRLVDGVVYVISKNIVSSDSVCPIPLSEGTLKLSVNCTDIYHPSVDAPVDSLYTVIALNPKDGTVSQRISFLGSSGFTVTYVSSSYLYLTDTYYKDMIGYFYDFYASDGRGLISQDGLQKLANLKEMDISTQAKLTELSVILERYYASLGDDKLLTVQTEFTDKMNTYSKSHMRELERTKVAKVKLTDLTLTASGEVPGRPLNQFSLDEYKGFLRVATTSGDSSSSSSINDVYVLDENLKITGSVLGLGEGERIYAVRFLGENGYVVTFKQTDPFYVLDLENTSSPKMVGELKIPGYSSYLHPVRDNIILGIGKEDQKVKLSLFDVGDPANPNEVSKYVLDEYWSDVLSTHHAFLQDADHQIFFIPGGKGGYIFSYKGNTLELKTAIELTQAKRALYIGNYLYVVSNNEITVFDETSWEKVNTLEF